MKNVARDNLDDKNLGYFLGTFETCKESFLSAFSICVTVLLTKIKQQNEKKD